MKGWIIIHNIQKRGTYLKVEKRGERGEHRKITKFLTGQLFVFYQSKRNEFVKSTKNLRSFFDKQLP